MSELLLMKGIDKRFPGVHALKGVNFSLKSGEVHTLVGENGAGKSTLINILFGALHADSGSIFLNGKKVHISHPIDAHKYGIHAVQQHFSLIPTMTVAENLFYGHHHVSKGVLINWKLLKKEAAELMKSLGFGHVPIMERIDRLSVAEGQRVEIAKAILLKPKILIMDEPSAVLPEQDIENLFRIIRKLKSEGVGIIYISHHLDEVFEISDRISVLKDGENVDTITPNMVDQQGLVKMMVGREISDMFPQRVHRQGQEVLRLESVTTEHINGISFQLHKGEVLGISGLVGSGRTELCRALFGLDCIESGTIEVYGKKIEKGRTSEFIREGIGFVTEDRHKDGLILSNSVNTNITFVGSKKVSKAGFINKNIDRDSAERFVRKMRIATPHLDQKVKFLSGGNQQKVVLSKWLFVEPKILLLDEPTRGIDVGAKVEIYKLINDLVQQDYSVIMVSSELQEIIQMSDRILVMRNGSIAGEFNRENITEETIIACASGI